MQTVTIVKHPAGDWHGLYLDGEIQAQNHQIDLYDWETLLPKLGVEVVVIEEEEDDDGNTPLYGRDGGHYPHTL